MTTVPTDAHPVEAPTTGAHALVNHAEGRLARIAEQHTPYNESLDLATGIMCRECGFLHPCPTLRMANGTSDPNGKWLSPEDMR